MFTTEKEAVAYLYDLIGRKQREKLPRVWESFEVGKQSYRISRGARYSPGRLRDLLTRLEIDLTAFTCIHVVGTSGKGSLVQACHKELLHRGERVASYVSPHVVHMRERFRVMDGLVRKQEFLEAASLLKLVLEEVFEDGGYITYREALFALFLLLAKRAQMRVLVVEVGSGGRYDLTNIIPSRVVLHTGVSKDHMGSLGPTLREVTFHQGGSMNEGCTFVTTESKEEYRSVLRDLATHVGCSFLELSAGASYDESRTALVDAAMQELYADAPFTPSSLTMKESLPSRFELVSTTPPIVIDGAHNPEKMEALAAWVKEYTQEHNIDEVAALVGVVKGKDVGALFAPLFPLIDEFFCSTSTEVVKKTLYTAGELSDELKHHTYPPTVHMASRVDKFLEKYIGDKKSGKMLVVTGSMYFIGAVRKYFETEEEFLSLRERS